MGEETTHVMQCMEVWGGNRAIDNGVMMPGLDAWVYSLPFGIKPDGSGVSGPVRSGQAGGGDIHYVTSCATGRITRMTIADVSGHGESVSQAAEALRRLMHKYSNYIDQTRFFEEVNRRFGEIAEAAGEEDSGAAFATAVVATYFAPTDELFISNAGHPRPLRFDSRQRTWSAIVADSTADTRGGTPSNLPLGVADSTSYPQLTLRLARNDLVMMYTDSLIEARDSSGKMLGQQGLLGVLEKLDPSRPETFIHDLLLRLAPATGGSGHERMSFDDDVTALLIRRNDLKPRPGLWLGMLGGIRVSGEIVRSLFRRSMPMAFPEVRVRSLGGAFTQRLNGTRGKG